MQEVLEMQSGVTVAVFQTVENDDSCNSVCVFADDKERCRKADCTATMRQDGRDVYFRFPTFPDVSTVKSITKERIIELALKNGFKLKLQEDGSMALNAYVFDFIADVLKEVQL